MLRCATTLIELLECADCGLACGCLQESSTAQGEVKELGLVGADAGPSLVNVLELDFGDLLQDDAARVLLRPSKKQGSDQANGYHLDAESNAWLQAFQDVSVWVEEWQAGQQHGRQGRCCGAMVRWLRVGTDVLCCWLRHWRPFWVRPLQADPNSGRVAAAPSALLHVPPPC